jgi:quercetin dioxygenase-like cupin family protein
MNNTTDNKQASENLEASQAFSTDLSREASLTKNEAIAHQEFFIPLQYLPPSIDTSNQKVWFVEGLKYGFFSSSVLIADVSPGAGPPLHLHYTEEIQILPECRVDFLIGDMHFTVEGSGVINIPANTPHTFLNLGDKSAHIVSFFPTCSNETNSKVLGPNPLLK